MNWPEQNRRRPWNGDPETAPEFDDHDDRCRPEDRHYGPAALTSLARRYSNSGVGPTIRESAGVNVATLAWRIRVSPDVLEQWETGARIPTGPGAQRWARELRRITTSQQENL